MAMRTAVMCLMLACGVAAADEWVMIQDVNAKLVPGSEVTAVSPSGPMVKAEVEFFTDLHVDDYEVDIIRTVLYIGPDKTPLDARHHVQTRSDSIRGTDIKRVRLHVWFEPPEDASDLAGASLQLALKRHRFETFHLRFERGENGWEFPLTASNAWMTMTIDGVGVATGNADGAVVSEWVGSGGTQPDDAREFARGDGVPRLVSFAHFAHVLPPNVIEDMRLTVNCGGHNYSANGIASRTSDRDELPGREGQASYDWSGRPVGNDGKLPSIDEIYLLVKMRVPMSEAWRHVKVKSAEE